MASISSLSSSTNSALGTLRGYGGLSSGLDRDTLIEGMTYATQSKITKQEQAKQKLEWQMEAYREISDKMIAFADKYTATMTSSTNLFNDSLWNAASTSVNGANSKYIGVIGTSKSAANVSILGVQQVAKQASLMTGTASDNRVKTDVINTGDVKMNTLIGAELNFKIGENGYAAVLSSNLEPFEDDEDLTAEGAKTGVQKAVDAINQALQEAKVTYTGAPADDNLFNHVEAQVVNGKIAFVGKDEQNIVTLHDSDALKVLGFDDTQKPGSGGTEIGYQESLEANEDANLVDTQTFAQRMGEKTLTFNYNGKTATIELPSAEEIAANAGSDNGLTYVKDKLQASLDAAFGKDRVTVELEDVKDADDKTLGQRLTFKTTIPNTKEEDSSSTLTITEGSANVMSSYAGFGIIAGESNRVNLNIDLKASGINLGNATPDADGNYELEVNGKKISFTENDTMQSIMNKINSAGAGVQISYLSTADKFVIQSTEDGAAGVIQLTGSGADLLFGEQIDSTDSNYLQSVEDGTSKNTFTAGQDAIVAVKYAGSNEPVLLTRGSNNINIEGLDIVVKGTFGYDEDGKLIQNDPDQEVTFTSNIDTDKLVSAMSDLVNEYNEILDLVNTQLTTRPDRDYAPLTSEQKKEMSESEIALWEEKAKAGLLYNSSELRSLADDLRWMINPVDQQQMSEFGITVSTNWQDNGKLSFDENKFKAALEKDIDAVRNFFTKEENGDTKAGFAVNLKNGFEKYVKTLGATKGILIEKAGSTKSPLSLLNNSILTEMNDIDKILESLKARLKSEQDRYISQFTQLETLISQMNSQSSYLSGMMGY